MTIKSLAFLLVTLALAGCASTPGGGSAGQTGTSSLINGVEVWEGGPPSRPYDVIATVQRLGVDGSATYRQQEEQIADEASQRGADAVIVESETMVVSRVEITTGRNIMAPKVVAQLIKYQYR